jgi:hypothetical protein
MSVPVITIGLILFATLVLAILQGVALWLERRHAAMFSRELSDAQKETMRRHMQRALDHRRYFVWHVIIWAIITIFVALIAVRFVAIPFTALISVILLHGIPVALYFTRWNPDSLLRKSTSITADYEGSFHLPQNSQFQVGDDGELVEIL